MHINLEPSDTHAIQSYSDSSVQINSVIYDHSVIVSRTEIITDLTIKSIQEMDEAYLQLLLQCAPELIIIGHKVAGTFPPLPLISKLSQQGIGIETMSIGAAARTFNVLLSEQRDVVAGFIL